MPAIVRVAVDADGAALRACLDQRLALIKPNHRELEELVDRSLPTIGDVVAAAEAVVAGGIQAGLVSLGPDGALLVDGEGASHAEASAAAGLQSVRGGDALP